MDVYEKISLDIKLNELANAFINISAQIRNTFAKF